jgi:hypothetical protein
LGCHAVHQLLFLFGRDSSTKTSSGLGFKVGALHFNSHEDHQGSKTKIPGLRFATYRKVVITGREDWVSSNTKVVCLCLESFATVCLETRRDKLCFTKIPGKQLEKKFQMTVV